jgi:probable F420-dependent oxidoreductase
MSSDQFAHPTQEVALGRTGIWTVGLTALDVGALDEAAREIEELGYGTIWSGEAPGLRDVFTQALALLGATERLAVASGIMNIYFRDPGTANAASRTVAALHPGRFVLGVGVSHQPLIEGMLGLKYGKPLATMRTYLGAMEAAPFGAPEARTPGPPVLIAALGPKMLELARDRTQGSHPYLVTPEHTRGAREILGTGKTLAVEQGVVLTTDRAVGLARGRQPWSPTRACRTTATTGCGSASPRRRPRASSPIGSWRRSSSGATRTPSPPVWRSITRRAPITSASRSSARRASQLCRCPSCAAWPRRSSAPEAGTETYARGGGEVRPRLAQTDLDDARTSVDLDHAHDDGGSPRAPLQRTHIGSRLVLRTAVEEGLLGGRSGTP